MIVACLEKVLFVRRLQSPTPLLATNNILLPIFIPYYQKKFLLGLSGIDIKEL